MIKFDFCNEIYILIVILSFFCFSSFLILKFLTDTAFRKEQKSVGIYLVRQVKGLRPNYPVGVPVNGNSNGGIVRCDISINIDGARWNKVALIVEN